MSSFFFFKRKRKQALRALVIYEVNKTPTKLVEQMGAWCIPLFFPSSKTKNSFCMYVHVSSKNAQTTLFLFFLQEN